MNYEITITVSPSYPVHGERYGKMLASHQWDFLKFYIYESLKKINCEYAIYPEFHKNHNIHVHGHCIMSSDVSKIDIVDIEKRFNKIGRSNFKPTHSIENWITYIKKNQEELDNLHYLSPNYLTLTHNT